MKKLSEIQKVGIFFDASSEKQRKAVKAFIKELNELKITTSALGFFNTHKPEENFISDRKLYFSSLKDFSFFFLPKSEEVREFTEQSPDALFVFAAGEAFPASAVVNLSRAHLKVGYSGLFGNALDLTFEISDAAPEGLIEQIKRYL